MLSDRSCSRRRISKRTTANLDAIAQSESSRSHCLCIHERFPLSRRARATSRQHSERISPGDQIPKQRGSDCPQQIRRINADQRRCTPAPMLERFAVAHGDVDGPSKFDADRPPAQLINHSDTSTFSTRSGGVSMPRTCGTDPEITSL